MKPTERVEPGKGASAACHEIECSFAWASQEPMGSGSARPESPARRPLAHEHPLTEVTISEDGRRLFANEYGRRGWIWDLETGRRLARATGDGFLAFARDGESWLTVGRHYTINFLDGRAPLVVAAPAMDSGHHAYYDMMDVSGDGRRVVVKGWPRSVELFETGSARPLAQHEPVSSASRCVRFTRDGRHVMLLVFPGGDAPAEVLLLDASSLKPAASWRVPGVPYSLPEPTLVELPGGEGLAVVGARTAYACRIGAEAMPLVPRRGATGALAFSHDGGELAVATERGIELWDLARKKPALRATLAVPFLPVRALAYRKDGSLLATQANHVRRVSAGAGD